MRARPGLWCQIRGRELLDPIRTHLVSAGIEVVSSDAKSIITRHRAGKVSYEVQGFIDRGFPFELPLFFLKNRSSFGLLAHVGWPRDDHDTGLICSGASDVLSLNYHAPEKLYEEALNKARQTIDPVLNDASLNEQHCLEEFYGHWKWAAGPAGKNVLVIAPERTEVFELQVRYPAKNGNALSSRIIAGTADYDGLSKDYCVVLDMASKGRSIHGKGILFAAPCLCVPPAPGEDIKAWWKKFLAKQPEALVASLKEKARHTRAKEVWIVCHAQYQNDDIWFGIWGKSHAKCATPLYEHYLAEWDLFPIEVDVHARARLLPRAGASIDLQGKSVLLVGCGSVGGNIAEQLVSSGIGSLHLVDSDTFQSENLYRHPLSMKYLGANKASGLARKLENEYPYTGVTHTSKQLCDLQIDELAKVDLIIVAIGNPTAERAFNEMLVDNRIKAPVIYCWLEGYGVGGHAVFVAADGDSGCLECAYVDPQSYEILMHSNMNFLKANEPVSKDVGGCGTLFLPYSHLDALQTAIMTSKLALRVLMGQQNQSIRLSWVGDKADAKSSGLEFSEYSTGINGGVIMLPLKQKMCPCCRETKIGVTFSGHGKIIHVSETVRNTWEKYRQRKRRDKEACGILMGRIDEDGARIWIDGATEPMPGDVRRRSRFYMKDKGHQAELNRLHESSGGIVVFLGTWHSHPESKPSFSSPDKTGWKSCMKGNPPLRHFCFAIIGTKEDSVFIPKGAEFVEMKRLENRE